MGEPGAVVVGTGFGCLTHVRALRAAGFEVRGLVGRNPERTADRARRFDIPYAATSLSDVLERPGVDAVTVATPPDTHAPLVLEALEAGRHVMCEKPFAMSSAEARVMLQAAERHRVIHLIGTEFRFATGQALLRRTVAEGAIGQPRLATFMLHMPLLAGPAAEVPQWWSDARQGGGWLGAHAVHVVDQIRSTLGEFRGCERRTQPGFRPAVVGGGQLHRPFPDRDRGGRNHAEQRRRLRGHSGDRAGGGITRDLLAARRRGLPG